MEREPDLGPRRGPAPHAVAAGAPPAAGTSPAVAPPRRHTNGVDLGDPRECELDTSNLEQAGRALAGGDGFRVAFSSLDEYRDAVLRQRLLHLLGKEVRVITAKELTAIFKPQLDSCSDHTHAYNLFKAAVHELTETVVTPGGKRALRLKITYRKDFDVELDLAAMCSIDTLNTEDYSKGLPLLSERNVASLDLAAADAAECIVCLDRRRNTRLICGHEILCSDCAERLKDGGTCPQCRSPIPLYSISSTFGRKGSFAANPAAVSGQVTIDPDAAASDSGGEGVVPPVETRQPRSTLPPTAPDLRAPPPPTALNLRAPPPRLPPSRVTPAPQRAPNYAPRRLAVVRRPPAENPDCAHCFETLFCCPCVVSRNPATRRAMDCNTVADCAVCALAWVALLLCCPCALAASLVQDDDDLCCLPGPGD